MKNTNLKSVNKFLRSLNFTDDLDDSKFKDQLNKNAIKRQK